MALHARSVFAALLFLVLPVTVMADAASQAAALQAQCDHDREAKLKPLRDAQIAKCKAEQHDDPDYCARFWSDYGNGGRRTPRLFDDLPSCVAAAKARKALEAND